MMMGDHWARSTHSSSLQSATAGPGWGFVSPLTPMLQPGNGFSISVLQAAVGGRPQVRVLRHDGALVGPISTAQAR